MLNQLTTPELEEVYRRGFSRKVPSYAMLVENLDIFRAETFFVGKKLVSVVETKKYLFINIINNVRDKNQSNG